MTFRPPPRPPSSFQRGHGGLLTEWETQNHFKLMDLRDCPRNYIRALQQAPHLHTCSSGVPQNFIHIMAPLWNAL